MGVFGLAEIIMIASGKGGVGKSTLCLGLAAGFSASGQKVLILEADTGFRGLDIPLSLEQNALYDLGDLLEQRSTLEETLLRHSRCGIDLICAPNDPEYLPDRAKLTTLLAHLADRYDHILLDCGAGFGPVQSGLAACSTLGLVVTVPDRVAVRAAARVSLLLGQKGLQHQRLVINHIPPRLPQDQTIRDLDDVINLVGLQLIGAVPEGRLSGMPRREDGPAQEELFRIAERLMGRSSPLLLYR